MCCADSTYILIRRRRQESFAVHDAIMKLRPRQAVTGSDMRRMRLAHRTKQHRIIRWVCFCNSVSWYPLLGGTLIARIPPRMRLSVFSEANSFFLEFRAQSYSVIAWKIIYYISSCKQIIATFNSILMPLWPVYFVLLLVFKAAVYLLTCSVTLTNW